MDPLRERKLDMCLLLKCILLLEVVKRKKKVEFAWCSFKLINKLVKLISAIYCIDGFSELNFKYFISSSVRFRILSSKLLFLNISISPFSLHYQHIMGDKTLQVRNKHSPEGKSPEEIVSPSAVQLLRQWRLYFLWCETAWTESTSTFQKV